MTRKMMILFLVVTFAFFLIYPILVIAASPETVDLYAKKCQSCHGEDGSGKTKMGEKMGVKPFAEKGVADEAAWKGMRPKWIEATTKGTGSEEGKKMPGFEGKVSEAEIAALVDYCRELALKK